MVWKSCKRSLHFSVQRTSQAMFFFFCKDSQLSSVPEKAWCYVCYDLCTDMSEAGLTLALAADHAILQVTDFYNFSFVSKIGTMLSAP